MTKPGGIVHNSSLPSPSTALSPNNISHSSSPFPTKPGGITYNNAFEDSESENELFLSDTPRLNNTTTQITSRFHPTYHFASDNTSARKGKASDEHAGALKKPKLAKFIAHITKSKQQKKAKQVKDEDFIDYSGIYVPPQSRKKLSAYTRKVGRKFTLESAAVTKRRGSSGLSMFLIFLLSS